MADDVTLPGSGAVIATDDIGGRQFQRIKLVLGDEGDNDGDVSAANPVPMSAAVLPLPTGAATSALQTEISGKLPAALVDGALAAKDRNGTGAVRYTTDTTAVTGTTFAQIMCLTETTFSTLTRTSATGSLTGVTLPPGILLIGPFTAYTLASGAVAAYV